MSLLRPLLLPPKLFWNLCARWSDVEVGRGAHQASCSGARSRNGAWPFQGFRRCSLPHLMSHYWYNLTDGSMGCGAPLEVLSLLPWVQMGHSWSTLAFPELPFLRTLGGSRNTGSALVSVLSLPLYLRDRLRREIERSLFDSSDTKGLSVPPPPKFSWLFTPYYPPWWLL